MKQSEFYIFCNRMNRNVRLKNFSIFFDVADGMILCGRNVAFHVWKVKNLIESETMEKETRFEVFTSNLAKYLVHPKGLEPLTFWSVARRSIQLSYGCSFVFQYVYNIHRIAGFVKRQSVKYLKNYRLLNWNRRRAPG